MRYILQNRFSNELQARQEYLYLALKSYFVVTENNYLFTVLRDFPFKEDNIIMLYGHNDWVATFFRLLGKDIVNFVKVVNSCSLYSEFPVLVGQENLYYCKLDGFGRSICYDGSNYGLTFDVTESELDFLNVSKLPLMKRIEFSYRKVA